MTAKTAEERNADALAKTQQVGVENSGKPTNSTPIVVETNMGEVDRLGTNPGVGDEFAAIVAAERITPDDLSSHYVVNHSTVGSFSQGDVLPADYLGNESSQRRLLFLGAISASNQDAYDMQPQLKTDMIDSSRIRFKSAAPERKAE